MLTTKPNVARLTDGSCTWTAAYERLCVRVYVPRTDLPDDLLNFGYEAPYLVYFTESLPDEAQAKALAETSGLAGIAANAAGSVVFVAPRCEGGWKAAPEGLYEELIENTKIHQYHEDGVAILNNRFRRTIDGYAIRGAIYRAFVYGKGDAADYIAAHLLRPIQGAGLWGPADIVPTACILEGLSVPPVIARRDMPIVSVGNPPAINDAVSAGTDHCLLCDTLDFPAVYDSFLRQYMRWGWVGTLERNPDFAAMGMVREWGRVTVPTSPDNQGDDKGSATHEIGYLVYRNAQPRTAGPLPLLLCFHGGGDSAMHIAQVSAWYRVARDHDFLLVCVENHLNSTAAEMMTLLAHLKTVYPIDTERIYGSGFSMGGCKSWDLFQEYPAVFAGLAPMSATFDVGLNVYGQPAPCPINQDVLVPLFYVGGEQTPLPELPFQAEKCRARMAYVLKVNRATAAYDVTMENVGDWANPVMGINGDETERIPDPDRSAILTLQKFRSDDGEIYTVFGSVDNQGHECRYHSCEHAWRFLSGFRRLADGRIVKA